MKINNWISIAGRIDDGEPEFEDDSWFTKTAREGEDIPLRADRWFQSADVDDGSHSGYGRPACEGISCKSSLSGQGGFLGHWKTDGYIACSHLFSLRSRRYVGAF